MPRSRYEKPPVIEVLCAIEFSQDSPWDGTMTGLVYEQVKRLLGYVKKEPGIARTLTDSEKPKHKEKASLYTRFLDDEAKSVVQVGPHSLSVHRLAPYTSWEQFRPVIEKALHCYVSVVEPTGIKRVGLRYINRIIVPEKSVLMGDYFRVGATLGDGLPQDTSSFIIGLEWPHRDGRDVLRGVLSPLPVKSENECGFHLDLDYFTRKPGAIDPEHVVDWADDAHQCVNNTFEGFITEKLRSLFRDRSGER